ncbi:MAG: acyltransferase family protein [Marinagarivorans sp.]|nr:acyltransferase family protein [Marinagarivorans sp.]
MNILQHQHKNHFRPDIEGMRAIAILSVVAAHFALPGFSGGFIGVDIFFVISGYLITSILIREYEDTQRIALLRFYANRLRRLLPALATVVIASSLVAHLFLPETQNLTQSKAGAAAILWLSNLYFVFADMDYFASEHTHNIFLHTWSLGVEEQFYLLWPLGILLACFGLKNKITHTRLMVLFGVIAIISLAACLTLVNSHPSAAFYLMPTRAWQFAAGALIWLLAIRVPPTQKHADLAGWLGLFLLLASLFLIGANKVYPSILALIPTLGTCALLWAGTTTAQQRLPQPTAFLSTTIMQKIGRLSYTWYLWHWPVLVLGEELIGVKGNLGNTFLTIVISLALAVATLHLIENPIRFGRPAKLLHKWQILAALVVMVLINSQLLRWYVATEKNIAQHSSGLYAQAASDLPAIYSHGCDEWYHSAEVKPCIYGNENAKNTAVLMGDSIGAQWFSTIAHMLDDADNWKLIVITKSSCPMVDEPYFYQRIGREYTECADWRNSAIEWLQQMRVQQLFVGRTVPSDFTDAQWKNGTLRILQKLAPHTDNLYLIEANPTLPFNGPECLQKSKQSSDCSSELTNQRYQEVALILKDTTQQIANAHWIATSNLVCPNGVCQAAQTTESGEPLVVYRDSQHLTNTFTIYAAKYFKQQVQYLGTSDHNNSD